MSLYYETVSDNLISILRKIMESDYFSSFRLVGGTALSLQRGHRRSIDIDLFTDLEYGSIPKEGIRKFIEENFSYHKGTEMLMNDSVGYHIYLGNELESLIKLDLFYTDPFIFPTVELDGIRMADQREIAAMKMLAITGDIKRQKDFWDIHEMLASFSIEDMIDWGIRRHPYSLTRETILEGLRNIDSVEESVEGIDSLNPMDYWELKVMDMKELLSSL